MRLCIRSTIVLIVAWAWQAMGQTPRPEIVIVDSAASDYEIVSDPAALQSAREGARELQRLIRLASGAELPLVETASADRKQIVVGAHALAQAAQVTAEDLPADGFRIRAIDGNLYFVGDDDDRVPFLNLDNGVSARAGSYFAVIEFAHRFLGARWYMPGPLGEEIPRRQTIAVPADLDITLSPAFPYRTLDICAGRVDQQLGGKYGQEADSEIVLRWGRHLRLGNSVAIDAQHAWFMWMPAESPNNWTPQSYGKDHPEYFALHDGKRRNHYAFPGTTHGGQLCVSNPDVARIYADNIIAYAKRSGARDFSLSSNDGAEHCECDNCRAWDLRNDAGGKPVLMDRFVRFANAVAERVTREIPDATFGLYAYETTTPSLIKTHPNIRIDEFYNQFPYRFHSEEARRSMEADMRGWREQAGCVLFSSYYTGATANWLFPWSTLDSQDWLIKMMAEYPSSAGVRMLYVCGDLPPMGLLGPDPWVVSRLLWDPTQPVEELKQDFYTGAFGDEAGAAIRDYFELINSAMSRSIRSLPASEKLDTFNLIIHQTYLVDTYAPIRSQCRALIDRAVAAVANADERYRWRADRIARGWRCAELTLDAIAAARAARAASGPERSVAWNKAVELGRQRQALLHDPESRFALAPLTADHVDQNLSQGIVTEISAGESAVLEFPSRDAAAQIDGRIDEAVWQVAARSDPFRENLTANASKTSTQVLGFRNDEGLNIAFVCAEPAMADLKTVDDPMNLWTGDVIEVFLSPLNDLFHYAQYSVNPNGIGREIISWSSPGRAENERPRPAWRCAASQQADGWTVEMLIPWPTLALPAAPQAGAEWYANFYREHYTGGDAEMSAWLPTRTRFSDVERFGRLRFAGPPAASGRH